MKKSMIKGVSFFQIYLLIASVISFSLILNINFVSAQNKWVRVNGVPIELNTPELKKAYAGADQYDSLEDTQKAIIEDLQSKTSKTSSAPLPTKGGSSMLAGALGMEKLPEGETTAKFGAWTTGTYTDAIVSGAQWAAVVGLGAYVLGSFIGLEEGQTNALSLSASMGALTGKSLYTLLGEKGVWQTTDFGKWVGAKFPGGAGGLKQSPT